MRIFSFNGIKGKANKYFRNMKYMTTETECRKNKTIKLQQETKYLWETTLPSIFTDNIKTVDDWKIIRNKLLNKGNQITHNTIDSIIISFCIRLKNYKLAQDYVEFLKRENMKLNLATIGKYFKLYYLCNNQDQETRNELDILNLYKEIRQNYSMLDATTCENVIRALSITSHWKECLKLLDEIRIAAKPTAIAYSLIAAAAFRNKDNDLAWQLLTQSIEEDRVPLDISYLSYLEQYKSMALNEFLEKLGILFEFFRLHNVKCSDTLTDEINSIYKNFKTELKIVNINSGGVCPNCRQKLQKFTLSKEDFHTLKTSIFNNVIVGKNVFYKTTPEELTNFKKFITAMPKYDVVIDGLNVAYSTGTKQSPHVLSTMVVVVVKHFVDQNKKVLVLGRTHMKKWPSGNWSYIMKNADCFLTQTLSQDDPYLLYCALHSGLNTIIVSKDLMRGHVFKLNNPYLKMQFSLWLMQNQHQVKHINIAERKAYFKYPLPYLKIAQKQGQYWHVPCGGDEKEDKWLCINC